jgi:hypothetical protein
MRITSAASKVKLIAGRANNINPAEAGFSREKINLKKPCYVFCIKGGLSMIGRRKPITAKEPRFYRELHSKAFNASRTLKRAENDLIKILQEVEQHKAHLRLGYRSMYTYCTKALELSEGTAYNLITVARKAKVFPKLQEAIESGKVSVTRARRICSVINNENIDHWIDMASHYRRERLEREIAKVSPRSLVQEGGKKAAPNQVKKQEVKVSHVTWQKTMLRVSQDLCLSTHPYSLSVH